ncbi:hypothetical protein VFPFJ_08737 [Purpureocillium lilacinum]|uniref:C2H2 finger domain-containing protein n=2 Tax=Purpureocillium lilacinum TaxID=33203 RepID=A0A179GAJ8_PURLI|nr:hypothetical protein VFPFJ_08737 [Purpureocillium lilacinum]KAK4089898.1 hypothetical protein Purlil1_6001 [Purpureocillium lilacinum]OAQ74824.1 hypothetical protein VFPBJ_10119 [Purpureocillium lilacinum]OAQ82934.1 hypothetical protein VFPFJ_08737 [Purpureocillium lilacinum]PWI75126.1 C2H2 finger domain-containing protein [Purpureocillium lilacinum]
MDPIDPSLREQYFTQAQGYSEGQTSPASVGDLGQDFYTYGHTSSPDNHGGILSATSTPPGQSTQPTEGYAAGPTGVLAYAGHHNPDSFHPFQSSFMPTAIHGTQGHSTAAYQFGGSPPHTSTASEQGGMQPAEEHGHGTFAFLENQTQSSPPLAECHVSSTGSDGYTVAIARGQVSEYACSNCEETLRNSAELKSHKKVCKANFPCLLQFAKCQTTFTGTNEWKRHMKSIHFATEIWVCTLGACSMVQEPLAIPRSRAWNKLRKPIPENGRRFTRLDSYKTHVDLNHRDLLSVMPPRSQKKLSPEQVQEIVYNEPTDNPVGSPVPPVMYCFAPGCDESFVASYEGDVDHCNGFLNHMSAAHLRGGAPVPDRTHPRGKWMFDYGSANGFLQAGRDGAVEVCMPYGKSNNKCKAGVRTAQPCAGPSKRRN